ncbi:MULTISPECIES: signal peptidase I [Clostridium]|uniref:Signal peptidase I n=2 Tax=Clostridium beijerinckii TaxID=1520 RepID=A0A0B5QJA0_CLOBE|nr:MULTISPECIES: signal peptidase I [Clostridium]AJH01036.1 S26 family signal peptidase [Clostridium beijerinckii]AQS06817.1 signal peptidase I T [Clostridium beijerinckii]MBA2883313.1 signal peptidase I [Clostridium beijerinckii]MBA2898499.1 signal peptidase I [Clostridium beijerinckii]MBA2907900.1 signal peptidase I [Clostridium beijerinckii]
MEESTKIEEKGKKKSNFIKDWIIPIFCALVIAFLLRQFVFFNVYVPTGSMIPTINLNDKILVTRIHNFDNLKRGNVIVFYSDELKETLVKRLIGLPGDKIDIKNGIVFVNGEKLEEDYVKNKDDYNGSFEVPQGKYFFLGDNRPVSLDARYWKEHYIDSSKIEGKAQFIFYPFKDFGMLK